jgi:hypothetical protein
MVTTLLRLVGVDVKRLAREAAVTIVLAILGAFVAMLALSFGVVALYLWLELKLGIFAALSILGGISALLAGALFAIAFLRGSRKPRTHTDDALRAVADPVQASAAAIAQAADEAVNGEWSGQCRALRLASADRRHHCRGRANRLGAWAPIQGAEEPALPPGCPIRPSH